MAILGPDNSCIFAVSNLVFMGLGRLFNPIKEILLLTSVFCVHCQIYIKQCCTLRGPISREIVLVLQHFHRMFCRKNLCWNRIEDEEYISETQRVLGSALLSAVKEIQWDHWKRWKWYWNGTNVANDKPQFIFKTKYKMLNDCFCELFLSEHNYSGIFTQEGGVLELQNPKFA